MIANAVTYELYAETQMFGQSCDGSQSPVAADARMMYDTYTPDRTVQIQL
jgi:hypothetical protein